MNKKINIKNHLKNFNALIAIVLFGTVSASIAQPNISNMTVIKPAITVKIDNSSKHSKILVLGDSLSAEYGLKRGEGWVNLLEKKLESKNLPSNIQNASISGETSSGGKSRIDKLLELHKPSLVIIELGANDALRGLSLKSMQDNLDYIARKSVTNGAKVLILGMSIPPNFGASYARDFSNVFSVVAKSNNAVLVDFFLKNVADIANPVELFQSDKIHPSSKAHPIMMENVYTKLAPMLKKK